MMASRPAGDAALLIDTGGAAPRLAAAVTAARLAGVLDAIPGARTVLVITEPGTWDLAELAQVIEALPLPGASAGSDVRTEIPVLYDGPDLTDVARLAGLPVAEVIARHQASEYTVGWLGFSPGFGYLTGLDPMLSGVPRLASPRLRVPAGSVAIAGGLAAVYPAASPGGWRLLGRTTAQLWDPCREPPSLLAPGMRVRFRSVTADQLADAGEQATGPGPPVSIATRSPAAAAGPGTGLSAGLSTDPGAGHRASPGWPAAGNSTLEVVRPGPLATIQDLGRHGLGSLGVPPSGAADAASLRLANRLAGNPAGTAGIELTFGRAAFRCTGGARLAVTGAPVQVTVTAGPGQPASEIAFGTAFEVPDGGLISVGAPAAGLRSYLAVTGGIDIPAVLGSRSSDLLSGLGCGPLRPGAVLPVGTRTASATRHTARPARTLLPPRTGTSLLRIVPGPRLDWFGAGALTILSGSPYSVTAASNRTGLRLDGQALPSASAAELASEGIVTGALQVPPDGKPILLLADHPTVGGYPVIAVLASTDIGLAAQLRPGQQVRFTISH